MSPSGIRTGRATGEAATAFRRPIAPWPIERYEIPHPALPPALDGLTVLHLSDLHARSHPHARLPFTFGSLLAAMCTVTVDVVALTGDFMHAPGHERGAIKALELIAGVLAERPARIGAYGVFGNHDTPGLIREAVRIAGITWLAKADRPHQPRIVDEPSNGLRVIGLNWPEDTAGLGLQLQEGPARPGVFPLTLAHMPTTIVSAAQLGLPLILAGHTHAGQVRLHARHAPYTSSDLPPDKASGVLRLRETLCCISRGLGDSVFPGLRFNCRHHAPLYTLRSAPLPALGFGADPRYISQVIPW
ncbi:MAG: metallophosphoesterase [Phycisphaeraceae bacterium]|nr:metallophosphoesterase [Phycisphaeraceae bacterium]